MPDSLPMLPQGDRGPAEIPVPGFDPTAVHPPDEDATHVARVIFYRERKEIGGGREGSNMVRRFLAEGTSMNWVVKLERIDEAGNLQSAIVGYVERPDLA